MSGEELQLLVDHLVEWSAAPPSEEREAEFDLAERELLQLSPEERVTVLRRAGL